jgi:hypothetical protein
MAKQRAGKWWFCRWTLDWWAVVVDVMLAVGNMVSYELGWRGINCMVSRWTLVDFVILDSISLLTLPISQMPRCKPAWAEWRAFFVGHGKQVRSPASVWLGLQEDDPLRAEPWLLLVPGSVWLCTQAIIQRNPQQDKYTSAPRSCYWVPPHFGLNLI